MYYRSLSGVFVPAIAVILHIASTVSANSYSCIPITPCEAFGSASAVFIGRVIDGTHRREFKNNDDGKVYVTGRVRFAVEEIFHGISGTMAEIVEPNPDTATSYIQGEQYLVYAYERDGKLTTSNCSRTKLTSNAKVDLEFLRNLPEAGSGGRLYGRTVISNTPGYDEQVLQGVRVTAINEQQESFTSTTDSKGYYEFTKLKQGKYRVIPDWPEHYTDTYDRGDKSFTVHDGGCTHASFYARIDSSVKGSVFDSEGRPAPARLALVSTSNKRMIVGSRTGEAGEFDLISMPSGKYFLMLYSFSPNATKPIYYPGVTNKSQAEIIEIGFGEKLSGFNFRLPENQRVRTIKGRVTYPDGRAAEGELVVLRTQDKYPVSSTTTDSDGNFTLSGFEGGVYDLGASVFIYTEDYSISSQERILSCVLAGMKLDRDVEGIKLVLKPYKKVEKLSENSQQPSNDNTANR